MSLPQLATKQWVAVRVKSNFESYVSASIKGKNLESFCPMYSRKSKREENRDGGGSPLFPGYLFSRLDYHDRLPVLKIPGVVGFVGIGKQPLPVREEEIDAVRRMIESRLAVWPCAFLRVGQQVRLKDGPLRGVEGSVVSIADACQIVVTITLLQRSVAVNVNPEWITALN